MPTQKHRSERRAKTSKLVVVRSLRQIVRQDADFLAEQIDAVATLMWALAERMEYFAGFNGEMVKHSREMAGASVIARKWAAAIRKPNPTGLETVHKTEK